MVAPEATAEREAVLAMGAKEAWEATEVLVLAMAAVALLTVAVATVAVATELLQVPLRMVAAMGDRDTHTASH